MGSGVKSFVLSSLPRINDISDLAQGVEKPLLVNLRYMSATAQQLEE